MRKRSIYIYIYMSSQIYVMDDFCNQRPFLWQSWLENTFYLLSTRLFGHYIALILAAPQGKRVLNKYIFGEVDIFIWEGLKKNHISNLNSKLPAPLTPCYFNSQFKICFFCLKMYLTKMLISKCLSQYTYCGPHQWISPTPLK